MLSEILAKDMTAIKLYGPIRFVTVGAPKYFEKMGRPKHPKDLLSHNCIRIRLGETYMYDRWEFEQKGEEFQVQVKGSLIFNDTFAIQAAALDGAGKLEIVLNQFAPNSAGFYLYYPQKSQVQPKLRAFIDHIKS